MIPNVMRDCGEPGTPIARIKIWHSGGPDLARKGANFPYFCARLSAAAERRAYLSTSASSAEQADSDFAFFARSR